jgi:uncharacterized protein
MLNIRYSLLFTFSFLLTACVTINVYFPAAAAEKAADQIIDNVWGKEQKETKSDSTKPAIEEKKLEPKNAPENDSKIHQPTSDWLTHWLNFLISNAHAGVNLDISTPTIQALQKRMAKRHKELKSFYNNGAIGLTNDALITLRSLADVPIRKRTKVKRWVNEENQDRLNLYYQIAKANGHPEWKDQIRAIFSKRWIKRALRGWWYKNDKGRWQQKR